MKFSDIPSAIGRSFDKTHWGVIGALAIFLALAPWPMGPEPHLVEKWGMFLDGNLTKPIDIFDVFYHCIGLFVLAAKGTRQVLKRRGDPDDRNDQND